MSDLASVLASVSLPRLRLHPVRTAITVGGVTLGVAVLVAVALVNRTINGSIASTIDDVAGRADLEVSGGPLGLDAKLVTRVRALAGVEHATPLLQESVHVSDVGLDGARAAALAGQQLAILGVDLLGDERYFRSYGSSELDEIRADPIQFFTSPTNLILGEEFARRHGFHLRDTIPLATPAGRKDFTICGFIRDPRLGRALGGAIAVMDYQSAQLAFDRGQLVDRLDVAVVRGVDREAVRAAIASALGPGYEVGTPARRTERIQRMLAGFSLLLLLVSLLSLIVGLFLIHNTVFISAVQRRTEVGILRALGMTRRQVITLFVAEGTLLGAVGSLLGVGLGLLLARALLVGMTRTVSELYLQVSPEQVRLDPVLILGGFLLGVVGTLVSSYGPARQASFAPPVLALRSRNTAALIAPSTRLRTVEWIAIALVAASGPLALLRPVGTIPVFGALAIAALLLGGAMLVPRALLVMRGALRPLLARRFGVEVRMANENVVRDLGRSALSGGALMIAVSMVTTLSVMVASFEDSILAWVDQTLPADVFITNANPFATGARNTPMSNELFPFLAALPHTRAVDRMRITDLVYRDARVKLLSVDWSVTRHHGGFKYLSGGGTAADDALAAGTSVLVSENFARRFLVRAGDPVELFTPAGPRRFTVAGVVVDYTSDQGLVLMDRTVYSSIFADSRVDTYKLYLDPGTDVADLRARINARYGDRYTLFILSNAEFKNEIRRVLAQMFQLVDALQLVAIVIAVLGVVNTMLASVLDRTGELGTLRAVGGLRRQVRKLVILESCLLGVGSGAVGVMAGLGTGVIALYVVNTAVTGWIWPFAFPALALVKLAAAVLLATALAGWYPAGLAAGAPITESLKYE